MPKLMAIGPMAKKTPIRLLALSEYRMLALDVGLLGVLHRRLSADSRVVG